MPQAQPKPAASLLSPTDHTLLLIDHQPQMTFAVNSIDAILLRNNVALVSKAAKEFGVSTILTSAAEKSFAGPLYEEIRSVFPEVPIIDRTTMNSWEDVRITDQVNKFGKSRIVLAGLWTSVCIVDVGLSALEQGFEVHVLADACGDVSTEAHERAIQRVVQAGARPMTSLQYLLELQRDWARTKTYDLTMNVIKANGGSYGLGVIYAKGIIKEH
jgi:nicotinamidase-related amidase